MSVKRSSSSISVNVESRNLKKIKQNNLKFQVYPTGFTIPNRFTTFDLLAKDNIKTLDKILRSFLTAGGLKVMRVFLLDLSIVNSNNYISRAILSSESARLISLKDNKKTLLDLFDINTVNHLAIEFFYDEDIILHIDRCEVRNIQRKKGTFQKKYNFIEYVRQTSVSQERYKSQERYIKQEEQQRHENLPIVQSGARGIINTGNNCYFISALQCLFRVPNLTDQLRLVNLTLPDSHDFVQEYLQIMTELERTNLSNAIDPARFKVMLERFDDGFNNNDQQDAAEFLQVFLRAIGGEIGGNTFEGEETIYRTCLACNEITHRIEPFSILTLPLSENVNNLNDLFQARSNATIEDRECERCLNLGCHEQFKFTRLPAVLIIQLGRFSYTSGISEKNKRNINYPIHALNLDNFISSVAVQATCEYELFAVQRHIGADLGRGHYIAMARNWNENIWYILNDTSYKHIQETSVQSEDAYMLHYRKVVLEAV